jgi:biotin transport system substrate-specific component
MQTDGNQTLHNAIWPTSAEFRILRLVLLAVLGTLLLTVAAHIKVPFWPVPLTMQTFVVLVIGAAYGARLGAATIILYLAEGAAGLPVFAGGGGLAYMAGPTGGYLVGFLAAAAVIGWLAERGFDRRWTTALVAFIVGDAVIFVFGLAWLAYLLGPDAAIKGGLLPFLPGEVLKIALAVMILPLAWSRVRRR